MKKLWFKYRKQIALVSGAIAMAAYLTTILLPTTNKEKEIVVSGANLSTEMVQIYLLDEEDTLIPYSIAMDLNKSTSEKLKAVLSYMVYGSEPIKGVRGPLAKGVELKKIEFEQKTVLLHFNERFFDYAPNIEMRILEAIAWSATQFKEVDQVKIVVNDSVLTHMPRMNIPIPEKLNRNIGINNFETSSNLLHQSSGITVYYTKEVNEQLCYVPKTKRIASLNLTVEEKVRQIVKSISVSSQLKQPLFVGNVTITSVPFIHEETLVVDVSEGILAEEKVANHLLYEMLVLSLKEITGIDKIQLRVDGVTINLSGANDEAVSVSNIHFNVIKL